MQRQIGSFPLPFHVRYKLISSGYLTTEDIRNATVEDLIAASAITTEEAEHAISLILGHNATSGESRSTSLDQCLNALDILKEERTNAKIVTFSQRLDDLLHGGIPLGKITEICGMPGTGKTQLCLQLCASVQIPEVFGGIAGEAVYIDAEGSFIARRMQEIAQATVRHCWLIGHNMNSPNSLHLQSVIQGFTAEKILCSIRYYKCGNHLQLLAIINTLQEQLKARKIKLIVIDSIDFHFRFGFDDDPGLRIQLLSNISNELRKMALEYSLSVVLTNHMTSKFDERGQISLVPSLGKSWAHSSSLRLILSWPHAKCDRVACLNKCSYSEEKCAPFQITFAGIRDVIQRPPSNKTISSSDVKSPNSKKPRVENE